MIGCLLAFIPAGAFAGVTPLDDAPGGAPQVQAVRISILVDESGSITSAAMAAEQNAANLIAQAEFAPGSEVSVVGFGSDNGLAGQTPVDTVCPPTPVDSAQDREVLVTCVAKLRKRDPAQGNGTDHAAALSQALNYLSTSATTAEPGFIFLLTDGVLDVDGSPRYGPDNVGDQRDLAALRLVDTLLAQARADHIEVWPLGFGDVGQKMPSGLSGRQELANFAAGAYQGSCGPDTPTPSATIVSSPADVENAVLRVFSAARCAGMTPITQQELPSGQTISIPVTIPDIATDGSIVVIKQNVNVSVSYFDPNNNQMPKSGTADGSVFQDSGADGSVEALRIVDPLPGTWTVRITSPSNVGPLSVAATVVYQGAVRAQMNIDPESPVPGQPITVYVRLQTRLRAITDPTELAKLSFTASMSGAGVLATPIRLAPDSGSNDGIYSGQVAVPTSATGALTFVGHVTGIGISGDSPVVDTSISASLPPVRVVATLPTATTRVAPGRTVSGSVAVANTSGRTGKIRLLVVQQTPGTLISIPQPVLQLPASGNAVLPFTMRIAANSALGISSATFQVVDDANPSLVYRAQPFSILVAYPPPPFPWPTVLGATVAAVLLLIFLAWWQVKRRREDMRSVVVELHRGSQQLGDLAAPEMRATTFRFVLRTEENQVPQLLHADRDDEQDCYVLRRRESQLRLRTPFGDQLVFHLGDRVNIPPDLVFIVHDVSPPVHDDPPSHDSSPAPTNPLL